ncbi:MAG TPA: class II fructose-bisphosphate aldolase [Polyangiaceae bacterium]|nr:class II fructose-bisphosphate aldolase [Polyangiaceae bacterium]
MKLSEALQQADASKTALGHFNFSELVTLKAAVGVARDVGVPVVMGASESERAFFGVHEMVAIVRSLRERLGTAIFLNADHTHSLAKAEEAARAGFDSVVFDASSLSFEKNVAETRRAVSATKAINPFLVVEGEIGYIGSGSQIHAAFEHLPLTTAVEARQFVEETHVDVLAPAVGTMHGMLPSMLHGEARKHLDIGRIAEIKAATKRPLTLHGASGTGDLDLHRGIAAGITMVHINTELRIAWRHGLEVALAERPDEVAPYNLFAEASARVGDVVRSKLMVFSGRETVGAGEHAPSHP